MNLAQERWLRRTDVVTGAARKQAADKRSGEEAFLHGDGLAVGAGVGNAPFPNETPAPGAVS